MKLRTLDSISEIKADAWNQLLPFQYPFASHAFLSALEESGSVGEDSGWLPRHLVVEEEDSLVAAMPVYEKEHSYGEYVFDWQWADAFHRYGRTYFPKLLTAIPFSPVTGPRLLYDQNQTLDTLLPLIREQLESLCQKQGYSSWHLLFPDKGLQRALEQQTGLMKREAVQFHWINNSDENQRYRNFDHFLEGFRSSKRKQIKRERRKISEQQLRMERRSGKEIQPSDWRDFYACYQATYLKRSGHSGYLNARFFERIAETMNEQIMLVLAYKEDQVIASSLFFFDKQRLYGRYWGALQHYDCLHFEACYYQGIEFAIERELSVFDPGTQGEHKLVRGFEPTKTCSFHWIADQEFAQAIDHFLRRERQHNDRYQEAAAEHLPFRRDSV